MGNHPDLSIIELVRVLAAWGYVIRPTVVSLDIALLDTDQELSIEHLARLGGTQRAAVVIDQKQEPWGAGEVAALLSPTAPKITVGLSLLPAQTAKRLGTQLKKIIRARGGRLRFILPTAGRGTRAPSPTLNAAQVIFNQLTTPPNSEFVMLSHDGQYYVARTVYVQDIQAYEQRDTARPHRDPVAGMLPPKLAQMMINITVAAAGTMNRQTIMDPFCGTGTILQEGWLAGHRMLGFDRNPRMVEASERNLKYVAERFSGGNPFPSVAEHDATQPWPVGLHGTIDAIVTEPYLGAALRAPLPPTALKATVTQLQELYRSFFRAARNVLKPGGHMLFLLPVWRAVTPRQGWDMVPEAFLDELQAIGYRRLQLISPLKSQASRDLIYARPKALVGRELTLWQKD